MTDEQQQALATLTVCYPNFIALSSDRVEDIAVCDSLVTSGHADRVESEYDGAVYILSEQMARAHCLVVEDKAEKASQN